MNKQTMSKTTTTAAVSSGGSKTAVSQELSKSFYLSGILRSSPIARQGERKRGRKRSKEREREIYRKGKLLPPLCSATLGRWGNQTSFEGLLCVLTVGIVGAGAG
jgi:hypothetical protein